jgi:hypothetical protein
VKTPATALALFFAIALAGAATSVRADVEPAAAVSAQLQDPSASVERPNCEGSSAIDARRLAREATKNGEHQRAAECFLIAGDNVRAHRAMIRAAADSAEAAKRNASVAVENARSQAKRIRAAFR